MSGEFEQVITKTSARPHIKEFIKNNNKFNNKELRKYLEDIFNLPSKSLKHW